MSSAGRWVLGLLLLLVGAVAVARTISSSDGSSQAGRKEAVQTQTVSDEKAAQAAAAAVSGDVACKKPCIDGKELVDEAVTTAKLAPGSVTLSKLAFDVPNLTELQAEIAARQNAERTLQQALTNAAANSQSADAATLATAKAALDAAIANEALDRKTADDAISAARAAGDAANKTAIDTEIAKRAADDATLTTNLNAEIAARGGAFSALRADLLKDSELAADKHMIVNNSELDADAVTTDKIANETIKSEDILNGEVKTADIGDGEVKTADLADASNDSSAPTGVTTSKIEDEAVTTAKIDDLAVTTAKLDDLAVTTAKLAGTDIDNATTGAIRAVTATALADGAVTNRAITNGAIALAKLDTDVATQLELDAEALVRGTADTTLATDITSINAKLGTIASSGGTINAGTNPVDWSQLKSVPGGFADGVDDDGNGKVQDLKNELKGNPATDSTINEAGDLVSWYKLRDVPADFADDTDDIDGGVAADLSCASCVEDGEIVTVSASKLTGTISVDRLADGSITGAKLNDLGDITGAPGSKIALGTITGQATPDNTITAPLGNIALKTIGGDNLADGAVDTMQLADGAVTADKLGANAVYDNTIGATVVPNTDTATTVAQVDITTPGTELHSILLNAQTVASCTGGTCVGVLKWQLFDGTATVGIERTITLTGPGDVPIFVSGLDTGVSGAPLQYGLVLKYLSGDTDVLTAMTNDITAVDLGVTSP